jgi:hypothetical protein
MLNFITSDINPDLFFWTGDNSPHNNWENTNTEVIADVVNTTDTILNAFADTNTTIFPI